MANVSLYDYQVMYTQKVTGILDIGTTFQQLISMVTPVLEAGTYMVAFTWEGDFNGQKNQPFEYQHTGDLAGAIYSDSVGDNDTSIHTNYYAYPKVWPGGVMNVGVQGRKAAAFAAQMDIDFIDVMVMGVA